MVKSILYRADANATIGWSHFYRFLALAPMLETDLKILFAVADPLPHVTIILLEKHLSLMP